MVESLPLEQYGYIIVLGIITGLLGVFYNKMTMLTLKLYDKITIFKNNQKILIPLMLSGMLMIVYPQILCGGHHIIDMMHEGHLLLMTVLILLILKFIFSLLSFGSGAPGGIFFPLLVLGSLIGYAYALVVTQYFGVNNMYFNNYLNYNLKHNN